ncbi:MAG TPA: thiolase family protein, partial [Candidatus Deferrimicrobiaceae bacterium]|nr:thiolase family protein [Candidatus Deferrimicrobiaceae bacterium]
VLAARKAEHKQLGLYDYAPISDGATTVVLTSANAAKKRTDRPVQVLCNRSATDYLNYPARDDLSHFLAAELAMKNACEAAKMTPTDFEVVEVYDQSTMMEMVSLEDLGFCKPGTAWRNVQESCQSGLNCYEVGDRQVYVNTNGGLKADGNPLGATGGAQIFEIFRQLRGEAGDRQVKSDNGLPQNGCVLEFEGFGTKAYVTLLGGVNH